MPTIGRAFGNLQARNKVAAGRFSVTVTMNEKLAKWLSEESNSTGRNLSEIVRRALIREASAQRAKKGLPEDPLLFLDQPPEEII
jgi:hypothetical protein